jgi:ABC-type polysaccharide/polyol phosphate transport system ATPase subunit
MTAVVKVSNLGKKFFRRRDVHGTFKSFVLGRILHRIEQVDFWALRGLHFEVKQGETLGIIGANGAGKSTLLSLIACTTAPTEGTIEVEGRMSTLLELGAGFHPDLTGRENVFLNASILGMSRRETAEKYDAILDLAGIGDAIDTPVKFFSSGMYVRLGFAVAVMCDPDILLMDEVLAVGDEAFRKKSLSCIENFRARGKTMLIVSHDLETIKRMADRVLLLNRGRLVEMGEPLAVVDHYKNYGVYQDGDITVKEYGTRDITIEDVRFESEGKDASAEIRGGAPLEISFRLRCRNPVERPVIGFGICDNTGNVLFGTNTAIQGTPIERVEGVSRFRITISRLALLRGAYFLSLAVHSEDHRVQYHRLDNAFKLRITDRSQNEGILSLPCRFERETGDA